MKHLFFKVFSLLLMLSLLIGMTAAVAEDVAPSERAIDMQVKVGNKVYSLACSIDAMKEQGLSFVSPDNAKAGSWAEVTSGRSAFHVYLNALDRENATEADTYVCGYLIRRNKTSNVTLPRGLDLATATRADVIAAYGATDDTNAYVSYYFNRDYIRYYFIFESEAEDSLIKEVQMTSRIPVCFGVDFAEPSTEENIPDPTSFTFAQFILDGHYYGEGVTLQKLQDNGWKLDASEANRELEPQGDKKFIILGYYTTLYNGRGMCRAFVYNPNKEEEGKCKLSEGTVISVGVNVADYTSMSVADGLTFGNTLEDVTATFGSNYTEEQEYDYTKYSFTTGNVVNEFNIMDGKVVYMSVQP